ncbi:hypothetical protein HYW75_02970 [Candidatus Pacearchaeota archaeon]|nr:hypothetical protein [Candidatus Pacearchaeota archaeon]
MPKKRKKNFVLFGAFLQIVLLVSMSFALAFLISKEVEIVSAIHNPNLQEDQPTLDIRDNPSEPQIGDNIGANPPGEKVISSDISPLQTTDSVSIQTTPSASLTGVKTSGGALLSSGRGLIPTKEFSFTSDTSFDIPVRVGDPVTKIIPDGKGGATFFYKSGAEQSHFTASQYEQIQQTMSTQGVGTVPAITQGYTPYKGPFGVFGSGIQNPLVGHLVSGLLFAVTIVGVIQVIGSLAGIDSDTTKSLSIAAFAGIMAGQAVTGAIQSGYLNSLISPSGKFLGVFNTARGAGLATGLLVAAAVFILTYKTTKKKMVTFQCLPFEPALGGSKCEECNKDSYRPCSEYRCKSLGQACQLLNPGTKEEKCAWVSPKDVTSPIIASWSDALKPAQYNLKFVPDTSIRPPALGVKIVSGSSGCLPAFTPLEFGIITNEPAQCKLDYNHTGKFDEMQYYFGGSNYFLYNHTQQMRLPGPNTGTGGELAPELTNDGTFALYTRCRDANGNENVDEYAISFCVDKGPDTTPPLIEGFSIPSGNPITFNQENVPIEVYTNEPADCKWSRETKSYSDMENTMQCSSESFQINANLVYTCSSNLTGIKNREENKFYFRCKDKSDNENVASDELILRGSKPLNILSVGPNETILGSTEVVPAVLSVETDDGSDEGKAICYFSPTGEKDSYIAMFETSSFQHKQPLSLTSGNYKYFFRCVDAGGNAAESLTGFSVFVDKSAPSITRAYKDEKENALKIVTNEEAACVYSLKNCNYNFADGLKMLYSNPDVKTNHFAEWKLSNTYYIKCQDNYGNEPEPNKCNLIVSAVQLAGKK